MSRVSNKEPSGATPTQDAPCIVISDTRRKPFNEVTASILRSARRTRIASGFPGTSRTKYRYCESGEIIQFEIGPSASTDHFSVFTSNEYSSSCSPPATISRFEGQTAPDFDWDPGITVNFP